MASKKDKEEAFNEEFNRVDQELKKLQIELGDLHQHHDELVQKLAVKETELAEKDEILVVVKERNKMELAQLEMEAGIIKERVQHEINFHNAEVGNLKHRKVRLFELKAENDRLNSTVKFLEESINDERRSHALELHEMNRNMKEHRHHMEVKLRKELNGLDISFQKDAFSALHDKQKRAMFQNAKLKDEVAIQGIGISNLNTRLAKQKILFDNTTLELNKLNRKSDKIKKKVGDLTTKKNRLMSIKEHVKNEIQELKVKKKSYIQEIRRFVTFLDESDLLSTRDTVSSHSTVATNDASSKHETREEVLQRLAEEYSELKFHFRENLVKLQQWQEREKLLNDIEPELHPTNQQERQGIYQAKSFPLFPLLQEIRRLRDLLSRGDDNQDEKSEHKSESSSVGKTPSVYELLKSGTQSTEDDWFDIKNFVTEDPDLKMALETIGSKENNILVSCNKATHHHDLSETGNVLEETKDQNMIAWVTLRILHAWFKVAWQAADQLQKLSWSRSFDPTSSSQLPSLHIDGSDSDGDLEEHDKQVEEELDALWQEIEEGNNGQAVTQSMSIGTIPIGSISVNAPSESVGSWLKKSENRIPLMSLVANELQSSLLRSSQLLPSVIIDDIGPPVMMCSSSSCKFGDDPAKSDVVSYIPHAQSRSQDAVEQLRATTPSSQLSNLINNDPLINKKRGKTMKTMKAHLENSAQYPHHEQTPLGTFQRGNSISTNAIGVGNHSAQTMEIKRSHSTGFIMKHDRLKFSSHL